MNYQEKEHATGRLLQVGDKYFFILAQKAGMYGPGRQIPVMKNYDEELLMVQAIKQYPEAQYFAMNEDYTAFIPDQKHEWLGVPWK